MTSQYFQDGFTYSRDLRLLELISNKKKKK
jgi:hypothetical protein